MNVKIPELMRNTILIAILCLSFNSYVYSAGRNAASDYLNRAIWSQVVNGFEVNTSVFVFSPWGFFFFTVNSIDNDAFFKNNEEKENSISRKDVELKELNQVIADPFFRTIPRDSTMLVRALYKNRLLYTLSLNRTDTLTNIGYLLPDNETGGNVAYDSEGDLISSRSYNSETAITTSTIKQSDSLSVFRRDDDKKDYVTVEECKSQNGLPLKKTVYREKKETGKRKFVICRNYSYDENGKLRAIINTNKKGAPIDSIEYYYENGQLYSIIRKHTGQDADMFFYQYENGLNTRTTIQGYLTDIQADKKYKDGELSSISILDNKDESVNQYEIEHDVRGKLASVKCKSGRNIPEEVSFDKEYIFSYNELGNLKSVKVVDNRGVVLKEINYEYEFRKI